MARKRKTEPQQLKERPKSKDTGRNASFGIDDFFKEARPWGPDLLASTGCGMLFFALYIRTLHPSIAGGDSGELIVSAHELGVAHPPGYPLFTMAAKAAMVMVRRGSPAYRVNLLNAGFSAAAVALLHLTVLRLTECQGSSLVAAAVMGLGRLVWMWSVSAEVFGLNNLFVSLLLLLSVIFDGAVEDQHILMVAYCGAFVCGLSLCNQHTVVLYVGCVGVWVLARLGRRRLLSTARVARLGAAFSAGLLPYAYLPLSAWLHTARWTWGDHTTLTGFVTHVFRKEYGTFSLGKNSEGLGFYYGITTYFEHLVVNVGLVEVVFAIAGVGFSLRRCWRGVGSAPVVFIVMMVVYALFFAWRANLNLENPLFRGVVERFWMQTDVVVSLLCGLGVHASFQFVSHQLLGNGHHIAKLCSAFLVAVVVAVIKIQRNMEDCDQSSNYVVRDFAMTLLERMPQNALVLSKGDLPTNSMRYLHLCEDVRPDLQILDQETFTYQWSLPALRHAYPKIHFPGHYLHGTNTRWPDGRISFDFKTFLDANFKRFSGVFACIGMQEHESSWRASYDVWPYGPCKKVLPAGSTINPDEWANETGAFANDWPYPHNGFDDRSWEKIANDDMWHAKIGTAFFLFQQGQNQKDPVVQKSLLIPAYKLYRSAIKQNSMAGMPHFWHKNYALACEKLLYLEHNINKVKLTKESVKHFRLYLQLASDDGDIQNIMDAISELEKRIPMYEKLQRAERVVDGL